MTNEDKVILEKMEARKGALKNERSSFVPHWQEINRFLSPRSAKFLRSDINRGEKRHQEIINETALLARRTLQSGLMAGMSSSVRPWFVLGPPDPEMKEFAPVKEWLDTVTKLMREVFVRSNLYNVLPKTYGTCGDYATAAFGLQEDDKEVIRGYPFPLGSFMIDCNARMNVDTIYREFSMTVRQIVERFGLENVSVTVRNLWDRGNYGSWIPVVHAIEPNFAAQKGKLDSRDKAYLSVYYEEGNKDKALRIMGYDDFPALAPRWYVDGEDIYGVDCPGMLALGSQKALQLEERRKYQAIDKMVNPPVNADATLRNSGADLLSGGVNWIAGMSQSSNAGIRPVYQVDPKIGDLKEDIKEVEYRIRRAYYEDLMLMLAQSDNPQMTAREIDERSQEKLLVLGPLMEQLNDDLFDPLIDRTFDIMLKRDMFPPPPEELQGKPLRVEYTSIMAQAQKLVGVGGLERFVGFVYNMAGSDPEILDKIDRDQIIDEYADMTGVSAKIVRSDDQVAEIRTSRAQAKQAEQMSQAMPAIQQGAQAAKALSETNVEGVNALTQLITGGGA